MTAMNLRIFGLAIILLEAAACKREQIKSEKPPNREPYNPIPSVDLSPLYRANKNLQVALSRPITERERLPVLDKLIATFKTELSILRDHIAYDQRLKYLSPLEEKYGQLVDAYGAYEEALALAGKHIDCMATEEPPSDLCHKKFIPKENEVRRKLKALGIECDPSHGFARGGRCDFATQIAPIEAEATRLYMQLTQASVSNPTGSAPKE